MNKCVFAAGMLLVSATVLFAADLKAHKSTYEKRMGTIVLEHGMKITELGGHYTQALDALLSKVQKVGNLDKTTAVMAEMSRFSKQKAMPSAPSALLEIRNLQSSFSRQATLYEGSRAKRVFTLSSKYDQALDRLQRGLVSSGKLDAAKAVQEERRKVQASPAYQAAKGILSEAARAGRQSERRSDPPKPAVARDEQRQPTLNAMSLKGLVVWHSFDKKSKKSRDKGKQRNHGRVHNAEYTLRGKVGGAFRFSGSDSYIRIPNAKSVALRDAFTLIAWVKIEDVQAKPNHFIISRYEWTAGRGYGLRVNANGSVGCDFNGTTGYLVSQPGLVESGKWVHLAAVFDGKMLTCVVDGVAAVSRERKGLINQNSDLFIGTPSNAIGHVDWSTLGLIDEVMIFNRPLSVDEVSDIFSLQE